MTLDWTVPVWIVVPLVVWMLACRRAHGDVRLRLTRLEARMDRLERML